MTEIGVRRSCVIPIIKRCCFLFASSSAARIESMCSVKSVNSFLLFAGVLCSCGVKSPFAIFSVCFTRWESEDVIVLDMQQVATAQIITNISTQSRRE